MLLRTRPILIAAAVAVLIPLCSPTMAETRLSCEDLLAYLTDLDHLPAIETGVYCRQFSSYDRASKYDEATGQYMNWDANGDAGQYLRVDQKTQEGVMAEMEGPGCIFRIWSANPQGVIRFYLDGDTKPTYEWDFHKLFTGVIDPFIEPLVWHRDKSNFESGASCYLPIPFAKSCKVTSVIIDKEGKTRTPTHYYIIDYRTFPKDWQIDTFKLPLTEAQQAALKKTAMYWRGGHSEDFMVQAKTIQPGESLVLLDMKGPATLKEFRAKLKSAERWAGRKVLLKAWWDGEENPSINCPINDFFGEPRDIPYRSYPMKIEENMNACFFPMPFRRSARIAVVNEGRQPAEISWSLGFREGAVPENRAYFHAKYRQEQEGTDFDYPLIEATGVGKLVGICLYPDNIHGGWWGEGDEKVYVDGEKFPSWFGTGSEDYFGDAWGIRYFENPSHGHPMKTVERMQGVYRWHLGDNIPFYKSFKMTIENYAAKEPVKNDYYSVAYWYQMPGGSDFFKEVPVAERIPRGLAISDAIEAEASLPRAAISGMAVIRDEDLPQELSRGRGVKLTGKTSDSFLFEINAPSRDRFVLEVAPARDLKHSAYELLAGGTKKVGKYAELEKGVNIIGIRFTGDSVENDRCELIVDYFRMAPFRNMITEWVWIGPFPNPEGKGLETPYPPETEFALDKKYAGRDGKEVAWQRVTRPDGMIVLNQLIEPREHCVVYAAALVRAPRSGKRELLIGSDDGVKIWMNGKPVFEKAIQRPLKLDEDRIAVDLQEGDNLLLIKVEQGMGDIGFAARFLDPKDELTYALPK